MKFSREFRIRLFPYMASLIFLSAWWLIAFISPQQSPQDLTKENQQKFLTQSNHQLPPRDRIKAALNGDLDAILEMLDFFTERSLDLQKHQIPGIQKITREICEQARTYISLISQQSVPEYFLSIYDDQGYEHSIESPAKRFLPQTYASASFLLSLTAPENLVALPKGFRHHHQLFDSEMTTKISLDLDRFSMEKMFILKPNIAFVASYSQPSTLESLKNQGIQLFYLEAPNSLEAIGSYLLRLGYLTQNPKKGELLLLFFETAMKALDNEWAYIRKQSIATEPIRPLFLYQHLHFNLPTPRLLTGQLIERLNLYPQEFQSLIRHYPKDWQIRLSLEQIIQYNPSMLIFVTEHPNELLQHTLKNPALQKVEAIKYRKIAFVDAYVQDMPTHHVVLAYYDLIEALKSLL